MRIVLTGGAGFLGSHLSDYLIKKGHSVIAIDNLLTGHKKNIKHLIGNKNFKFIKKDVTEHFTVSGKVDAVMHFASPASPKAYLEKPIKTLEVGSKGTHNALKLAKANKARFMLASTSEIYGDPPEHEHPQRETYWGNVNPIGERSVYDEAKRYAEAITMAYFRYYKVDVRIVRIFNTYGPKMRRDDGRAVTEFIDQILNNKPLTVQGSGKQTRSFCYVSDLVNGLYKLLMIPAKNLLKEIKGERIPIPVNIGNPYEITINKLADRIKFLMKSELEVVHLPLPKDDPKQRQPDITRAKKLLNWSPKVSLDKGLRKTIEYFKKEATRGSKL